MDTHDDDILFIETQKKMKVISSNLDTQLKELCTQGAITELDRRKLIADAMISGEAILRSLQRKDIPYVMKAELLSQLIINFETEVNSILRTAQQRLYTPKSIGERLSHIEENVCLNHHLSVNTFMAKHKEEVSSIRSRMVDGIQQLVRDSKKDSLEIQSTVEKGYQWYQQNIERIVKTETKLLAAESKSHIEVQAQPLNSDPQTAIMPKTIGTDERRDSSAKVDQDDRDPIGFLRSLFRR